MLWTRLLGMVDLDGVDELLPETPVGRALVQGHGRMGNRAGARFAGVGCDGDVFTCIGRHGQRPSRGVYHHSVSDDLGLCCKRWDQQHAARVVHP